MTSKHSSLVEATPLANTLHIQNFNIRFASLDRRYLDSTVIYQYLPTDKLDKVVGVMWVH
jgi:hypothetical protein